MAWLTLLRDGSNLSGDMLARVVGSGGGSLGNIYDAPTAPGIGTGFTVGVVGKMNGGAGADPNHFAVIATGTNLVLTIRAGWAWVRRDTGSASLDPRCLFVENNATSTVTLASNSQGSTRVDTIALRIDMSTAPDATGSNLPSIVIVQGGASSAVGNAPADGALYVPLANVTIANGATSVAQANVADKRYVHPSQCAARMWRSAALNGSGSTAAVAFDNKSWDFAGLATPSTGTYAAQNSGYYRCTLRASQGATTRVFATIFVNGVEAARGSDGTSVNQGSLDSPVVLVNQAQNVVAEVFGAASALEVGSSLLYFDVEFLHW